MLEIFQSHQNQFNKLVKHIIQLKKEAPSINILKGQMWLEENEC